MKFQILFISAIFALGTTSVSSAQTQFKKTLQNNQRIREALTKDCDLGFTDVEFRKVIFAIQKDFGVPIFLSQSAKDAGLSEDDIVSINVSGLKLRSALRLFLANYECTYVVKDEFLQIMTLDAAKKITTIETFDVTDLLAQMKNEKDPGKRLIEVVSGTVAPKSWSPFGGNGTIYELNGILIVRQSPNVHQEIGNFLDLVRDSFQRRAKPADKKFGSK